MRITDPTAVGDSVAMNCGIWHFVNFRVRTKIASERYRPGPSEAIRATNHFCALIAPPKFENHLRIFDSPMSLC